MIATRREPYVEYSDPEPHNHLCSDCCDMWSHPAPDCGYGWHTSNDTAYFATACTCPTHDGVPGAQA